MHANETNVPDIECGLQQQCDTFVGPALSGLLCFERACTNHLRDLIHDTGSHPHTLRCPHTHSDISLHTTTSHITSPHLNPPHPTPQHPTSCHIAYIPPHLVSPHHITSHHTTSHLTSPDVNPAHPNPTRITSPARSLERRRDLLEHPYTYTDTYTKQVYGCMVRFSRT